MKPYRRYFWILGLVIFSQCMIISLFNIAVDPYGIINSPTRLGFNVLKPEKDKQVRMFKAIDIIRIQPNTVFIGSSRTEFGLDPSHPALAQVQPAYNLGITGANIYEARRYFEHSIINNPNLKQAVIGLDLFMFGKNKENQPDFSEDRLSISHIKIQDKFNSIFSLSAFWGSINTVKANKSDENNTVAYFYPDGRRAATYYVNHIYGGQEGVNIMQSLLEQNDFLMAKNRGETYQISGLENLKIMVDLCQTNNISCVFFISPSHVTHWESIRVSGAWQVFEDWKRKVVKITPVWDFSGYNSITVDPLSKRMKNYIDSSHYRKEIGDLVLSRILHYREDIVPEDFGVFVTPENIETHLEEIREDRQNWAYKNPDIVNFVEDLGL